MRFGGLRKDVQLLSVAPERSHHPTRKPCIRSQSPLLLQACLLSLCTLSIRHFSYADSYAPWPSVSGGFHSAESLQGSPTAQDFLPLHDWTRFHCTARPHFMDPFLVIHSVGYIFGCCESCRRGHPCTRFYVNVFSLVSDGQLESP